MHSEGNSEVVVITGASAGVGRATAREFGKHGARVALLARNEEGLEGAKKEVEAAGGEALPIPTDVSDPEQVEAAAEKVERELGPIDVWVNDAIAVIFSPFKGIELADFKRSTEVCYLGTV
jgi:NAD(P)-dependent dehydrogenase (short-subunit alcohol dehydrogenase family)